MIGLAGLEVYNSIFITPEENNKIQLYTDTFDEFSFTELKDELQDILKISNVSHEHLQAKIMGPRIIKAHQKLSTEN